MKNLRIILRIVEVEGQLYDFVEGQVVYFEPEEVHRETELSQDFYMLMIKYPSSAEDKTIL